MIILIAAEADPGLDRSDRHATWVRMLRPRGRNDSAPPRPRIEHGPAAIWFSTGLIRPAIITGRVVSVDEALPPGPLSVADAMSILFDGRGENSCLSLTLTKSIARMKELSQYFQDDALVPNRIPVGSSWFRHERDERLFRAPLAAGS
jgi:hypothetical protein